MATGPTRETSAQCDCVNTHHSSAYSDTAYSEEPVRASTEGESLVWKDEHQSNGGHGYGTGRERTCMHDPAALEPRMGAD